MINAGMLLLLLLAASVRRSSAPGSSGKPARGGPWWPGEDNLGVHPVPADRHPEPAQPPLK